MARKVSPNLKVNVGADTSGFTKEMSNAKKELRAFEQTSSGLLSKLASAFGINTAEVEKLQNAFAGAGRQIAKMGDEGSKSLGAIVASAGKAASAIGAIGIGAAVTAFKLLNEEAEAFKNTVQGANIEIQTQAYLNTYRQAMHDFNSEVGKSTAEASAEVEKGWGRTWQNVKTFAVTALTQPQISGTATLVNTVNNALNKTGEAAEYALQQADKGEGIAKQIFDLQMAQMDATRRWADMEQEIAKNKLIVYNNDGNLLERQNALNRVTELIKTKYDEQIAIQKKLSELYDANNKLVGSPIEDIEKANQLYIQATNSAARMSNELRELLEKSTAISKAAQTEAAARQETANAIAKGVSRMQEYATAQIEMSVSPESEAILRQTLEGATKVDPIPVHVIPVVNTEEAKKSVLELGQTIQQTLVEGVEGIADSLGTLLGNLMTGESGMESFGNDLLEMVGTFAQKFGKVLIAFGVATEAFKASIESMNGLTAIAAGAALVAAGAAVKAVASNMASSMGAASATAAGGYVASSGSYGASGYSNSTLQVEVTGTLTANGSQLVAVLNNENNRKHYTT